MSLDLRRDAPFSLSSDRQQHLSLFGLLQYCLFGYLWSTSSKNSWPAYIFASYQSYSTLTFIANRYLRNMAAPTQSIPYNPYAREWGPRSPVMLRHAITIAVELWSPVCLHIAPRIWSMKIVSCPLTNSTFTSTLDRIPNLDPRLFDIARLFHFGGTVCDASPQTLLWSGLHRF